MNNNLEHDSMDDPKFQSVLVACLERLEDGDVLDREALLNEHPEYADRLNAFLDNQALLRQVASDIRDSQGGVQPTKRTMPPIDETMDSNPNGADFTAGDRVRYIGEYEILDEIARGGMGIVFKACQQKLNRVVALKMILSGKLADATDVERFHREAHAAGRLKHPGIVPVHDVGEHEGRHYFTMDFVEGRSLAEELREESLAPRRAAALLRTVAEAVHFAHQQGTVHRDLKPANILLTADGAPHITDFGLAKLMDAVDEESRAELTASGQILGTPSYMSPEQASGKQQLVGPASDIYSLGAILYASLTGRAPFVADSAVDTLLQVIRNEPVAPRTLNPSIPRDLETICLKCLTKEPHKRYGTAEELAEDLERFLDGRPVVARPVGPVTRYYRWCQRNPVIAALSVLLFASMALGTSIATNFAVEAERRAYSEMQQRRRADQQAELATKAERNAKEALRKEELAHQTAEIARARTVTAMSAEKEARQRAEQALDAEAEARAAAESARRTADWQAYVARMQQVMHVANDHNYGHLDRLLDAIEPAAGHADLRGWEWYFYRDLVDQRTTSMADNTNFDQFIRDPSDPSRLVASRDGQFELWNWREHKQLATVKASGPFLNPRVSPDGSLLAFGSPTGRVTILKLPIGERLRTIEAFSHHQNASDITGIVWDPSGQSIFAASCRGGDIGLWDADSGEMVRMIVDRNVLGQRTDSLDWHSEAGLASGHRHGHIRVWNPETAEVKWRGQFELKDVLRLKWNPAGTRLLADRRLATAGSDGTIRIWDTSTFSELVALSEPNGHPFLRLAWSHDGRRLLAGTDFGEIYCFGSQDMRNWGSSQILPPSEEAILLSHSDRTIAVDTGASSTQR